MYSRILLSPDATTSGGSNNATAEFQSAIEKARLEERAKLQGELDAATQLATTLQATVASKEADLAALVSAQKGDGSLDAKALMAEVSNRVAADANKVILQLRQETEQQLTSMKQQLHRAELSALKEKLIAEAGGPEKLVAISLIRGDTEAALRQAVKDSAEEYERVRLALTQATTTAATVSGQPPLPASASSGAAARVVPEALVGVKGASRQEWAANRDKVMAAMKQRFAGSSGR